MTAQKKSRSSVSQRGSSAGSFTTSIASSMTLPCSSTLSVPYLISWLMSDFLRTCEDRSLPQSSSSGSTEPSERFSNRFKSIIDSGSSMSGSSPKRMRAAVKKRRSSPSIRVSPSYVSRQSMMPSMISRSCRSPSGAVYFSSNRMTESTIKFDESSISTSSSLGTRMLSFPAMIRAARSRLPISCSVHSSGSVKTAISNSMVSLVTWRMMLLRLSRIMIEEESALASLSICSSVKAVRSTSPPSRLSS